MSRAGLGVVLAVMAAPQALGGAWVLPDGQTRVGFAVFHQQTEERYFLDARRIPYFFEGRNRTQALFVDAGRGLGAGLEVSLQTSVYRLDFDDLASDRRSTGLGDTRLGVRFNAAMEPLVLTLGARVKAPTGDFENDAEIVPVGEGQWDADLSLELGRSLWPRPGYLSAQGGYRFRRANAENGIDPGDEWFWVAEAGHALHRGLGLRLVARGLHGKDATSFGLPLASLRRKAVYVEPALTVKLGPRWDAAVAVPVTVSGRNWPAGPVLSLGVSRTF